VYKSLLFRWLYLVHFSITALGSSLEVTVCNWPCWSSAQAAQFVWLTFAQLRLCCHICKFLQKNWSLLACPLTAEQLYTVKMWLTVMFRHHWFAGEVLQFCHSLFSFSKCLTQSPNTRWGVVLFWQKNTGKMPNIHLYMELKGKGSISLSVICVTTRETTKDLPNLG